MKDLLHTERRSRWLVAVVEGQRIAQKIRLAGKSGVQITAVGWYSLVDHMAVGDEDR